MKYTLCDLRKIYGYAVCTFKHCLLSICFISFTVIAVFSNSYGVWYEMHIVQFYSIFA